MARVVICEFIDERALPALRAKHEVVYDPKLVDDAPRLKAEAATADALIVRNRTQVRGDLLAALARCRVVGRLGVGLDNIDVPACEARGMAVIPATGANALSVAEYVIASTHAAAARRLPAHGRGRRRRSGRARRCPTAARQRARRSA